ncbi:MAG TPA: hypothetical protein VLD59_16915 [Steroidobacteraceae bacterium]|nr:hypothetical protein [Steroidobacteraceae bacterium]
MRAASLLVILALTVGVNSCRLAPTGPARTQPEDASAAEPTPAVAAAQPASTATEPMTTELSQPASAPVEQARVDFDQDVRPILEARCQPCHFPGGVMYERRPFDRAETITDLGTKLFTRLKDENDRRVVSDFLAQQTAVEPAQPRH